MGNAHVMAPENGSRPIEGANIAERITCARLRRGWTPTQLGRAMGTTYRQVRKWETGERAPERESLVRLSAVLLVSIEELLGIAEGQDPPFPEWAAFVASERGQSMTPHERRMLQSLSWAPGKAPDEGFYGSMLTTIRGGTRDR